MIVEYVYKQKEQCDSVTDLSAFARLLSYKMRDKVLHENQVIRIKIENNSDDIKIVTGEKVLFSKNNRIIDSLKKEYRKTRIN